MSTSWPSVTCPSPAITTLLSRRTQITVVERILVFIVSVNFILNARGWHVPSHMRPNCTNAVRFALAGQHAHDLQRGPNEVRGGEVLGGTFATGPTASRTGAPTSGEQARRFPPAELHIQQEHRAEQRLRQRHQ